MKWRDFLRPAQGDRPGMAVLFMMVAISLLSFQDAWIKLASDVTSFWQIQSIRSLMNITLLVIGTAAFGQLALLRPNRLRFVALRAAFLSITMVCFFGGAPFLSPAEMGAGLYTFPIFVTLLSGFVLKEPVGPWRKAAVAVAALGAFLIVRPFETGFRPIQALPVAAGFFYACNVLIVRRFCRQESTFAMAFVVALAFLGMSIIGLSVLTLFPPAQDQITAWPFLLQAWPEVSWTIIGFALIASLTNLLGNLSIVQAYQSAEPSWLAPFDYIYLGMAVFWGVVMFGTLPDAMTIFGMALIAAAGLFTGLRERRRAQATSSVPPAL